MPILVNEKGEILTDNGEILTTKDSQGLESLIKKVPIEGRFTFKEIYFDTSKTVEEVDSILGKLTYQSGQYILCKKPNGSYGTGYTIYIGFDGDYFIEYFDEEDHYYLYSTSYGWDFEHIIDNTFRIPSKMAGGYYEFIGEQNSLITDVVWSQELTYVPAKEKVILEDLDYSYESWSDPDTHRYTFNGRCLDNKNVVIDFKEKSFINPDNPSNSYCFQFDLGNPKNSKISITLDVAHNYETLSNLLSDILFEGMFEYVSIFDSITHTQIGATEELYAEGTRYSTEPLCFGNNCWLFLDSKQSGIVNVTLDFDNEGFCKMYISYEFEV